MKNIIEDAYGTPPVARGGMMKVSGASDDDIESDDELLSDCDGQPDEYQGGNGPNGAPFYPREGVSLIRIGDLRNLITRMINSR